MSSGKFSARREVLTYRQHFALMWRDFIRANFESAAHAAHVFKVDPSTADNWWVGANAPQGWVVGRALSDPELGASALHHIGGSK